MNASSFTVDLVSPESMLVSGQARGAVIPGSEGWFTALPGHAPFISTLRPGVIEVDFIDGEVAKIFVGGGFAEVNNYSVTILAEQAIPVEKIKIDEIRSEIANAEDDIKRSDNEQVREDARQKHVRLSAMLEALDEA